MKKTSAVIILLAGVWATCISVKAMTGNTVVDLKDEGYGNDDAEYYNSEVETLNEQEPAAGQANSLAGNRA